MKTDRKADVIVGVVMMVVGFVCIAVGHFYAPDMSNWKFAYAMGGACMALAISSFKKKE